VATVPAKLEPDDTTGTTGTTGTTDTAGASTTSGADLDPTTKEATITGGSDPPVDQPEDGCACTASATSPGSPALGLLLGLLLLRSRRLAATASIERVTARCGGAGSHAS
jgi:MYXO-CTERM domain-containing protein